MLFFFFNSMEILSFISLLGFECGPGDVEKVLWCLVCTDICQDTTIKGSLQDRYLGSDVLCFNLQQHLKK